MEPGGLKKVVRGVFNIPSNSPALEQQKNSHSFLLDSVMTLLQHYVSVPEFCKTLLIKVYHTQGEPDEHLFISWPTDTDFRKIKSDDPNRMPSAWEIFSDRAYISLSADRGGVLELRVNACVPFSEKRRVNCPLTHNPCEYDHPYPSPHQMDIYQKSKCYSAKICPLPGQITTRFEKRLSQLLNLFDAEKVA